MTSRLRWGLKVVQQARVAQAQQVLQHKLCPASVAAILDLGRDNALEGQTGQLPPDQQQALVQRERCADKSAVQLG
jgi:hypothetical protein